MTDAAASITPPSPGPRPAPPAPLAPVRPAERLSSVDTLRGFALLGILAMNIIAFALPGDAYMHPKADALEPYQGPFTGLNQLSWWISYVFFEQKMMSIFSMLFGAGLVLMGGRAQAAGRPGGSPAFIGVYYRRLLWLFVIGMLHAYLIWYGDILVAYAICGLFLYPMRNVRPAWLIAVGVCVLFVGSIITTGMGALMMWVRVVAEEGQRVLAAGGTPSEMQRGMMESYDAMMQGMIPGPEKIDPLVAAMRGSLPEVLRANAQQAVVLQLFLFAIWTFWRALGLMLVGMGLMKLGVFAAARSGRFYVALAAAGLGLGLPLAALGAWLHVRHGFDMIWTFLLDWHFNYIGSFFVALGYIGVVMLICRSGSLPGLRARFAAVGRMALTNYLMQSILMTFVFYGWGLAYFARFQRAELYLFVLGVWILQLGISPIWLRHFRFGPAEWLWRSLTYWKLQPMRYEHT